MGEFALTVFVVSCRAVEWGGFFTIFGTSHPSRSSTGSSSAKMPAAIISWYCDTDSRQMGSGGIATGMNCSIGDEIDMTHPSAGQGQLPPSILTAAARRVNLSRLTLRRGSGILTNNSICLLRTSDGRRRFSPSRPPNSRVRIKWSQRWSNVRSYSPEQKHGSLRRHTRSPLLNGMMAGAIAGLVLFCAASAQAQDWADKMFVGSMTHDFGVVARRQGGASVRHREHL